MLKFNLTEHCDGYFQNNLYIYIMKKKKGHVITFSQSNTYCIKCI